jgi:hypothetical protein
MTLPVSRPAALRAALAAATLALGAAAAQASLNITVAVGTCPPGNLSTLQNDLRLTNGAVRQSGRNPPSRYFCEVPIDDLAAAPSWNRFEFQYIDRNTSGSGRLIARLMRRAIGTATAAEVVRVTSVASAGQFRTGSVVLPALDFAKFDYFVIVDIDTDQESVDAIAVRLVTR